MAYAFTWIILSFVFALAGRGKKIGYLNCFLLCLLLSPIVGLIIGLLSPPGTTAAQQEGYRWKVKATEQVQAGDEQGAIESLQKVIINAPGDPFDHYNLACLLSKAGKVQEALFTLQNAVARGYSKVDHMASDPDLANVRAAAEWPAFVRSGYKLTGVPSAPSVADELEKLAKLRASGVLTEEEFVQQKKAIIG